MDEFLKTLFSNPWLDIVAVALVLGYIILLQGAKIRDIRNQRDDIKKIAENLIDQLNDLHKKDETT